MLGQPELWWAAVGLFVDHFAGWELAWQKVHGDDPAELKKVHALRGAAANVGANQLACAAAVLEELIVMRQAGRTTPIPPSVRWYLRACFREALRTASEARLRQSLANGKGQ